MHILDIEKVRKLAKEARELFGIQEGMDKFFSYEKKRVEINFYAAGNHHAQHMMDDELAEMIGRMAYANIDNKLDAIDEGLKRLGVETMPREEE